MRMESFLQAVSRAFSSLTQVLNWVGYVSLSGIVLVTSADVIGRYFFNKPLLGALEVLELSMAVLGGFAMLYTTAQRGHISVDLFFVMFPKRVQKVIDCFGSLLGFVTWAFIAYEVYVMGKRMLKAGDATVQLYIPIAPFQFVLALGLALFSLALLIQGLRPLFAKESDTKDGGLSI